MGEFSTLLAAKFAPYGELTSRQLVALERHYELLCRWNRKLNLTRISDLNEAVEMHYCESLYVARFLPVESVNIADIGSGAGFPGIPVAVIRPDCSVDLIESDQRKAVFLSEAVRAMPNVRVIAKRAEVHAKERLPAKYDWGLSRAVSSETVKGSGLASRYLVLGNKGEKLPWGHNRFVLKCST